MSDLQQTAQTPAAGTIQTPVAQFPRVFKLNDYEWWAGYDLESIRIAYQKETGVDPDGPEGFDNPHELGAGALLKLMYHYDEYDLSKKRSFREELDRLIASGRAFPCFFAGTES